MPSSAGELILEIKRRLGDVNARIPDEADVMAYLNSALRGIWNYGIELGSPRISVCETLDVGNDGSVPLTETPVKVISVVDNRRKWPLPVYSPARAALASKRFGMHHGMWGYMQTMTGVKVLMSDDCDYRNVTVCYCPEFTALKTRDETIPFDTTLDDVVAAWAVRLIVDGRRMDMSDMNNITKSLPVNSLVQYFEGDGLEFRTGHGPW